MIGRTTYLVRFENAQGGMRREYFVYRDEATTPADAERVARARAAADGLAVQEMTVIIQSQLRE